MLLNEVNFSDIFLGERDSWLAGLPNGGDPVPVPEELHDEVRSLRDFCENHYKEKSRTEFNVRFNSTLYRACILDSIDERVFVLRRQPSYVPDLSQLGIHAGVLSSLLVPGISGLLVIAGAFSQGKTTTASAIIKERLTRFGGICVSIEDPPELPLQGRHGDGVCYQTEVFQGGFADACRSAARWAPTIIFLGEIRDSETATEALKASINGRLVICTVHADDVTSAIQRLHSLASGACSTTEDVSSLLSNGLYAVIHQKLSGTPRRPVVTPLFIRGDEYSGVRSNIKQRRWEQIQGQVNLQINRLLNNFRSLNNTDSP
jgi:twitching motility protein PilT